VICIGDFSQLIFEGLNTLLDDNKVLCLANGERIPKSKDLIFINIRGSTNELAPAFISRCTSLIDDF